MTPPLFARLQKASDYVLSRAAADVSPAAILAGLKADHAATVRLSASGNTIRCAGVTASCTWSEDKGLLQAWRKNATLKLMQENQK